MPALTSARRRRSLRPRLTHAREQKFQPLAVLVLDGRGVPKAIAAEDGTSLRRYEIAHGKAHGALSMWHRFAHAGQAGGGAAAFHRRGDACGRWRTDPGARRGADPCRRQDDVGAVGISGDTSDNDEAAALAGIAATGLAADPG